MNFRLLSDGFCWRPAIFTGLGFTAGFGWLWFAELGAFWQPYLLWGGLFSGGGTSLFYGALVVVPLLFFGAGSKLARLRIFSAAEGRDFRMGRAPYALHALAAVLVVGGLFQSGVSGAISYGSVAALVSAGLLLGLFWLAALLSLTPRQALAALIVAAVAALPLFLVIPFCPALRRPWLLIPAALLAWFLARELSVSLKMLALNQQLSPAPKRSRGRPAQKIETSPSPSPAWWPFFLPPAFYLLALGQAVSSSAGGWDNPLLSLLLNAVGLTAALHLSADSAPREIRFRWPPLGLICVALALEALTLGAGWGFWPSFLLEGFFWGAALSGLAESGPLGLSTLRRAALILGISALLGNAARLTANWLGPTAGYPPSSLALGLAPLALAALGGWTLLHQRRGLAAGVALTPEDLLARLSAREREVAELAMAGLRNLDISDRLCIAEDTIRFHLKNIYQKSGLSDRTALVALGRKKARKT